MLKALNQQTGESVVIISPQWKPRVDELRWLDEQNALVCPGCQQPVRVRAGSVRLWHFAHKHLANCPFERESPQLLAARAVLYEWLVGQLGEQSVSVEHPIEGLPRPLDAWVGPHPQPRTRMDWERGAIGHQPLAPPLCYWIFDTRMPPDERANLQKSLAAISAAVTWVFAAFLLRPEPGQASQIHLTTTEREFMQQTTCDAAAPGHAFAPGKTLHYLDAEDQKLITYRNLTLFHRPQLYAGQRMEHPCSQVQVDPTSGGFWHPGEVERVQHQLAIQEQRAEKIKRILPGLIGPAEGLFPPVSSRRSGADQEFTGGHRTPFSRLAACRSCGQITEDWISFDGKTGLCLCRECAE